MLEKAKYYYDLGLNILPIRLGQKSPPICAGGWQKYQKEKVTQEQLKAWFGNGYAQNIALITGAQNGITVVDADSEEGIDFVKNLMKDQYDLIPKVKTRRGYHYYFKYQEGHRNFQNRNDLPSIDLRSEGGYVIAPPSLVTYSNNGSGEINHQYTWEVDLSQGKLLDLPDWILKLKPEKEKLVRQIHRQQESQFKILDVASRLGIDVGGREGRVVRCNCFKGHDTNTPSLTFYPDTNSFYCYGCHIGGSPYDLVMRYKNYPFADSARFLRNLYEPVRAVEETAEKKSGEEIVLQERDVFAPILERTKPVNIIDVIRADNTVTGTIKQPTRILYHVLELIKQLSSMDWDIANHSGSICVYNGSHWVRLPESDRSVLNFLYQAFTIMGEDKSALSNYYLTEAEKELKIHAHRGFSSTSSKDVLINFRNGTLVIGDNVELKKHDKNDMIFYCLDYDFEPEATAPMFTKFMEESLNGKNDRNMMQEYIGYIFVRNSTFKGEKCMLIKGDAETGKSTFFSIIKGLLGNANMSTIKTTQLREDCYKAKLVGKLLNYSSEFGKGIDSEDFKIMVSGEPLDAREKYGHPFTIHDLPKFMFNVNEFPADTSEDNDAFWRRIIPIHFRNRITPDRRIDNLAEKIMAKELSGIMNWALEGLCRLLQARRFTESQESGELLHELRRETSNFIRYIEDNEQYLLARERLARMDTYRNYKNYTEDTGGRALSFQNFCKKMDTCGIFIKNSRNRDGLSWTHNNYYNEQEKAKGLNELALATFGGIFTPERADIC